jgi:hypothetical protein
MEIVMSRYGKSGSEQGDRSDQSVSPNLREVVCQIIMQECRMKETGT